MEAPDKFALYREVRKEGGIILSTHQTHTIFSFLSSPMAILGSVGTAEKIAFTRNLAAMIEAGLSLSRGLSVLSKQTHNARFKKVIASLEEEIRKGAPLHSALAKFSQVFSPLLVSMVKAGEESGSLAQSLKVVGVQMERAYMLKKKVRGAMLYPLIVMAAMVGIAILMLIYVVPTLSSTFKELQVELPASTQFIILASEFLTNNALLSLSLLLFLSLLFYFGARTTPLKRILHKVVLKIPVVGKVVLEVNAARTARTLSSLLSSGVSALSALSITRDVVQNVYHKEVLTQAEFLVEKGFPLSEAFTRHTDIYPVLLGEMVAVGEETGDLSGMLLRVAEFYEGEVEQKTKDMSTIIEPFLMIVVGAGVGFFALAMISPIYSLSSGV